MYAAMTKDEGNAAEGLFSTACKDSAQKPSSGLPEARVE